MSTMENFFILDHLCITAILMMNKYLFNTRFQIMENTTAGAMKEKISKLCQQDNLEFDAENISIMMILSILKH